MFLHWASFISYILKIIIMQFILKYKHQILGIILFAFIMCSCSPMGGEGCQGNKKMLIAGKGFTKFNK